MVVEAFWILLVGQVVTVQGLVKIWVEELSTLSGPSGVFV